MTDPHTDALAEAARLAAAACGRTVQLAALAKVVPADVLWTVAGQTLETILRDVTTAHREFKDAKRRYEDHCQAAGIAPYATYAED